MTEALILAIKVALPGVAEYLESRLQDVKHEFMINTQSEIKKSRLRHSSAIGIYGHLQSPVCGSESAIKESLFQEDGTLMTMDLQFLDIPYIFYGTKQGFEFIESLA